MLIAMLLVLAGFEARVQVPGLQAQLPGAGAIVYVRSGALYVANLKGREVGRERLLLAGVGMAAIDPATSRIAFFRGGKLWIAAAHGEPKEALDSRVASPIGPPSWNPNNGIVLYDSASDMEIRETGEAPQVLHVNSVFVYNTQFKPFEVSPGNWAEEDYARKAISWVDFKGSPETMPSTVGGASWSPDGNKIALCRGGDLWIVNEFHLEQIGSVSWDASRLSAIGSPDARRTSAENEGWEGGQTRWSPDGKLICVETRVSSHWMDTSTLLCDASNGRIVSSFGGGYPCFWGRKLMVSEIDGDNRPIHPYLVDLPSKHKEPLKLWCDYVVQVLEKPYP